MLYILSRRKADCAEVNFWVWRPYCLFPPTTAPFFVVVVVCMIIFLSVSIVSRMYSTVSVIEVGRTGPAQTRGWERSPVIWPSSADCCAMDNACCTQGVLAQAV